MLEQDDFAYTTNPDTYLITLVALASQATMRFIQSQQMLQG